MVRDARCTLCLSVNKRTINVYNTDLQFVYENLANLKVRYGVCWMCYICHTRLRQCHRLQQLAVQTRGLIDVVCENEMEIQFGALQSLLELTTSEIKIVSNSNFPPCIKEEPDIWTQHFYINETKHDEFAATTIDHEHDEKPSIKTCPDSEDDHPLVSVAASGQETTKLDSNIQHKAKELKLVKEKLNPSIIDKCGRQNPVNHSIREEYFKGVEVPISAPCINEQNNENVEIKKEIEEETEKIEVEIKEETEKIEVEIEEEMEEEIEDKGIERGEEQENISSYESRDHEAVVQIDSNERQYSCDICSKTFTRKAYLNSHSRTHSGHKPYSCGICAMKFSWKSGLLNHKTTHTGEKPFSCDICHKKFTQKGSLQLHMRTHTGEKPYSCDFCEKKFSQKAHLQHHVRSHRGEKPFSCHLCPKKFSIKLSLQYHVKTHTGTSYD